MIEIEEIREFTAHKVETKKHTYTRYSPQCWTIMGESEEPVYDCEELEEAYQKYKIPYMNRYLIFTHSK